MDKNPTLIGVFFSKKNAEEAYQAAIDAGYAQDEVNILMTQVTMKELYSEHFPPSTPSIMVQGGSIGGITGGILGFIAALGVSIFVPAFGLIIAGPLAGLVTGTLMGTLIAMGISEIQAQEYEEKLNKGAIILSVKQRFESNLEHEWKALEEAP